LSGVKECGAMVSRAMGWILENLAEFDPFKDGRPFAIKHGQRIGELAILLHSYVVLTGDRDGEPARRITELLEAAQENRELTDRLMRSPAEFVLFAEVYACLRHLGRGSAAQRALIQRALDSGFLECSERLPHRMMDISSCLDWGGFQYPWPSLQELYASSILGRVPSALYLDEDGAYALTHVLMFLYGFGTRDGVAVPPEQAEPLRETLSMLLVTYGQQHHWDLLGELLLCWECAGFVPTPLSERAWDAFLSMQNEDGSIPGPEWAAKLHDTEGKNLDVRTRREIYVSHHYHTTLVGLIAGHLRLRRLRRAAVPLAGGPVPAISVDPQREGRSEALLASVRQARTWMERQLDDAGIGSTALCRVLLGCWICDSVTGQTRTAFPRTAERIGAALGASDLMAGVARGAISPTLKLAAAGLLASRGVFVPSFHAPDGYLAQVSALLGATPRRELAAEMPLYEKRVLLHALGLHPAPGEEDLAIVTDFARACPLDVKAEDLTVRIQVATGCGTRRVTLAPDDLWIGDLLLGLAMHSLRHYDFQRGCELLRAASALGLSGAEGFRACMRFLRLHQRPEGAFGFFGAEERKLREAAPQVSVETELHLPVTLECVWALAEGLDPGWRLFESLPSMVPGPCMD
jgi:hypothetical protein